ncbi:MAG: bifunctional lysylphosphatidylglycerol flippase/synthetase MprF [Acidobacteriota bacterium]
MSEIVPEPALLRVAGSSPEGFQGAIGKRLSVLGPLLATILFGISAWILYRKLEAYNYHQILRALESLPSGNIVKAILLTFLSYFVLTGYDFLAIRYVGSRLSYQRLGLASFVNYAFNNNMGLSGLVGSSLRYRLYSSWGLSALQVARLIGFTVVTFWLGMSLVSGVSFILEPLPIPRMAGLPFHTARIFGLVLLVYPILYLSVVTMRRRPLRIGSWDFPMPSPKIVLAQVCLAPLDWVIAAGVLYAVLPFSVSVSFPRFVTVFLLAQVAGLVSNLPGGVGVFEAVILLLLSGTVSTPVLLASIVVYRAIYYLLPLLLASLLLGFYELARRREGLQRAGRFLAVSFPIVVPQILSITIFAGGAILLFSGATPGVRGRLNWLDDLVPLSIVEVSHFLGSVAGVGLLILSRGLQRRLDAAYVLSIILLAGGIVLSLFKGLDYEEAIVLAVMLAAILPCHRHFYRKASLVNEPFTPGWTLAIVLVVSSSILLGFFSYKHVGYSADLWWHFSLFGNAPRFVRASVGALAVALWFSVAKLLQPAIPEPALPTEEDLLKARSIVERSRTTTANLALLGDKPLLFSASGNGFLMFDIEGRTWVSMGDPVGPPADQAELAWKLREMSDRHVGYTVFYEIGAGNLPLYIELGLSFLKVGEEGRIPLASFTLDGGSRKTLRKSHRKLEAEGLSFTIIPREELEPLLPVFRRISDEWLAQKNTREKRFSLGYFDEEYLRWFPAAVIRRDGEIIAFANVWLGAEKVELSIDLMRHRNDAPPGVMDFLFLELIQWGRDQGYAWFNLGMAPLSGLERRSLGPVWNRLAALAFHHGEYFYNFQGLRTYKEKFDPVWQPVYIAAPRGLALPRVLANVASLISGNLKGVVSK